MMRIAAAVLLILLPLAATFAEVPVRTEQLIWSALAFNGRDYSPAFATESSDTIYLLAGVDNFLSARKTLVYWWPITSEWRTDTDSLNVQFPGTLELRDGKGAVTKVPLEEYTYFNVKGEYELNWNVATGGAARREIEKHAALYDSYFKAMQDYENKCVEYDAEIQELSMRLMKMREQGIDVSQHLARLQALPRPQAPAAPTYYVVPPAQIQLAFILNLAPGRYTIRLLNLDGSVMEGSEKTVVVHDRSRSDGIGFEVIPSDRWTRPESSVTPSSVLYVNAAADLYLRPYFQYEFNDLAYEKTLDTSARGNPTISKWVRIQQVPHATIVLERPGTPAVPLEERLFYVEQSEGSSLGYTIQPYDPAEAHKNMEPNLIAFHVPIDREIPALRFHALDAKGDVLAGSQREIRVVKGLPSAWLLVVLTLAPLLVMAAVLITRSRVYAAGSSEQR